MEIKNLVGQRFGILTVEKLDGKNLSNRLLWSCVCECGNTSRHTGSNLRCGHAKSCGCLRKKPKHNDLNGEVFGRLTVISHDVTVKGVCFWKCSCSCGQTCSVSTGHLRSGHTKSCGCLRSETSRKIAYRQLAGKRKIAANGTLAKRKTHHGYVKVHDRNHPRSDRGGFVCEHVKVMESIVGRHISTVESVHHLNGIRDDNRPENLELWSKSHPAGQRVEDKVKWAVEFLMQYAPEKLSQK